MRNEYGQILTAPMVSVQLSHDEVLLAIAEAAMKKAGFSARWVGDVEGPARISRDVAAWHFPLVVDLHDGYSIALIRCSEWEEEGEQRAEGSNRSTGQRAPEQENSEVPL